MYSKTFTCAFGAVLLCVLSGAALFAAPVTNAPESYLNIYRDHEMHLVPEHIYPPGTRIRNIHIHVQEVFEPGQFFFSEAANALHWTSIESSIRRDLLYSEGDEFNQGLIDESERILRKGRRIVEHTRIVPVGREEGDEAGGEWVDIYIDTRDIWSLLITPRLVPSDGKLLYGMTVEEKNFLGRSLKTKFFLDRSHFFTRWHQQFEDPRFLNSRWRFFERAGLRHDNDGKHVGEELELTVERPFFSRSEEWSWYATCSYNNGLVVKNDKSEYAQVEVEPDFFCDEKYYHKNLILETKLTRSFGYTNKLNVGLFLRTEKNRYRIHEDLDPAHANNFRDASAFMKEDSTRHKAGLSITANNHKWIRLRGYKHQGVIEDFPLGSSLDSSVAVSHKAWASDENAFYFSLELAHNAVLFGNQISQSFVGFTSAYTDENGQRDMVTTFRYIHHFRNVPSGTLSLKAETIFGERLDTDAYLTLGANKGFRGYSNNYFEGNRSILFSAEYRFKPFPSFQFWPLPTRGRLSLVLFADLGSCWYSQERSIRDIQLLPTAGVGLCLSAPGIMSSMARFNFATNFGYGETKMENIYSFTIGHAF